MDRSSSSAALRADGGLASSTRLDIPEGGTLESVSASPCKGPACGQHGGRDNTLTGDSCGLGAQDSGAIAFGRDMDIALDSMCDFPGCGEVRLELSGEIATSFFSAPCARKAVQEHHFLRTLPSIDAGSLGIGNDARVDCVPTVTRVSPEPAPVGALVRVSAVATPPPGIGFIIDEWQSLTLVAQERFWICFREGSSDQPPAMMPTCARLCLFRRLRRVCSRIKRRNTSA